MEAPPPLFVGQSFPSYDALCAFVAQYEKHHRQKFWKRSSRKISSTPNIKRHIRRELIYYEISYSCIYGGEKFKSRSKGLRKSITYRLEAPCPAFIKLRASSSGEALEIKSFNDRHQNHALVQNRWTITQVEALIAQYKTYPVLYSNSHKDRENVDLRNQCLSHVVQALQFVRPGVTTVDVVSQWNNLVIKYMQAARRQLEEPTGAEEPHLWYFKKMDFVGEHACLADVKVEDNAYDQDIFEPESTTEGHELWENGAGEDPLESSSRVSVKQEGDSPPTKKFREDEDTRESFSGSDRASKDENDVFGEFVAAELKKIADERIRQDTILEIHKVLHKALTKK